jgi:hypothetical protein
VKIEWRDGIGSWTRIDVSAYQGSAANYARTGFSAASYTEWNAADSTILPLNSWWREEQFDLSSTIGTGNIQFRFIIKRGNVVGSDISYGWLLGNFELIASTHPISLPIVHFVSPFVRDTVFSTGPWEINAKVKTMTTSPILQPWLKWTPNNGITWDSILMTMVSGDSLWKGTISQYTLDTTVDYQITGKDAGGNEATENSSYVIKMPAGSMLNNSAAMHSIDVLDTVAITPVANTPIEVTIKNKGFWIWTQPPCSTG